MKIQIDIKKELDKEQESRLVNYLYFKLLDDPALTKFLIKSDNFMREAK